MSSKKLNASDLHASATGNYGSLLNEQHPQDDSQQGLLTTKGLQDGRSASSNASLKSLVESVGSSVRDGVERTLHFGGKNVALGRTEGNSTVAKSSVNLIKNVVGAGVLTLPSGVCV